MAVSPWSLFQALGWEFLALGMLLPSTPSHGPLALGNWNPLRRSLSFGAKVDSPPHIKTHKCRRYTLQTPRNRELKAENNHGIFGKERPFKSPHRNFPRLAIGTRSAGGGGGKVGKFARDFGGSAGGRRSKRRSEDAKVSREEEGGEEISVEWLEATNLAPSPSFSPPCTKPSQRERRWKKQVVDSAKVNFHLHSILFPLPRLVKTD